MKLYTPSVILIAIALLLNGCGTTSDKKIKEDALAAIPEQRYNWTQQADNRDIEVGWIETFGDPTLTALVKEAQENNLNLQAAAGNVERARALAVQAGAALVPSVGLTAGGSGRGSIENASTAQGNMNVGLQMSWELDIWGRIESGQQAAIASAQAAEADYLFSQYSLAATTASAYFAAIEANLQTKIAEESLSLLEETMRIVNVQHKNGLASAQDVALTKADLASARERLITIQGSQRDASRAIELILGRYPSAELGVRETLPELPSMPTAGIPADILERRPDLIAAERRVAAAYNSLDQAKAAQLPSISLTSTVGGTSNELSNVLNPQNIAWQAASNLLAPLIDGGAREAQVDIATVEQEQALVSYAQTALTAFSEVENFLDQGTTLELRRNELIEASEEAQKAYDIASLRHKEGEISLLDVLTIQQRVTSVESNLVSLQRALLDQRINLNLALGGSWDN